MNTVFYSAADLAGRCQGTRGGHNGDYTGLCPAHDDREPSLSLGTGKDGRTLLKCHAGCTLPAICAAWGIQVAQLFPPRGRSGKGKIIATYDYCDANGTLLYQALRYQPKSFSQRRPDPSGPGRWFHDMRDVPRVLFRLPELLAGLARGEVIYVVEGEKDVLTLARLGLTATTNVGGAGKWTIADYSLTLQGARVAILPDNDDPGRRHAQQVAASVYPYAASVTLVDLPDLAEKGDVSDWLAAGGTVEALRHLVDAAPRWTPAAEQGPRTAADFEPTAPATPPLTLQLSAADKPLDTILNVLQILRQHPAWHGRLWLDSVRNRPMLGTAPVTEYDATTIAEWLGCTYDMRCRNLKLIDACVKAVCAEHPRDLLRECLDALPAWDRIPRLHDWLHVVAGVEAGVYCTTVSRLLPLSLVARALDPGSLCRYVVILQGPEDTGKSTLLHDLVGEEWYIETSGNLEGKEPHILIQGAWLCELSELDSLTRTEENRLKSFLTMRSDSYIPKYSNTRVDIQRRTVFAGTTNDETYLKGQTGNTRFFPITTGTIDLPVLHDMRAQLFAEALHVYRSDPAHWWVIAPEARDTVKEEREHRRVTSVYEEDLSVWLSRRSQTTWEELCRDFLKLDGKEKWKDKQLQAEVTKALKALGWTRSPVQREGNILRRYWDAPILGQ